MNIIYLITYRPHIGTQHPIFYIGSKFNYRKAYFGSLASKRVFSYTEGVPLLDWWKREVNNNPDHFGFEILIDAGDVSPAQLVEIEREVQIRWGAPGVFFFNQSLAGGRFVSQPKSPETRARIADKTRAFWASPEGQEKKARLREMNRTTKSAQIKAAWNRPGFRETESKKRRGAKRTDESRIRYRDCKLKNLEYKGDYYLGYDELEIKTGVSRHLYKKYYMNGIDPVPFIGSKRNPA